MCSIRQKFLFTILTFMFLSSPVFANDEVEELKKQMGVMQEQFQDMQRDYKEMMNKMQVRIDQLERERASVPPEQYEQKIEKLQAKVDQLEQVQSQSSPLGRIIANFNPDISFISDVIYHTTDEAGGELDNDFNFRELEMAISGNVDTYARADLFIAIENEGGTTEVAIEEGYLTLLETPIDNLQGRFGKFRPFFGKANKYHLHSMPWVDYPKVVRNFFGEEGFSDAGVSLNYLVPNPWDIYSEATVEAFNNNSSTVFGGGSEGETIYLGHLKNFFDINDETTLEIGGSHMLGDNGVGNGAKTYVSGVDLTFKWQPEQYKKWTSQTEALFSKKQQASGDDFDSWGMYSSLEHQFAQRWSTFGRYDFSQLPSSSETKSHAYSVGLTLAQSEYAFWRLQFTHTDNNTLKDINEVWLQLNFGLGAHRKHEY